MIIVLTKEGGKMCPSLRNQPCINMTEYKTKSINKMHSPSAQRSNPADNNYFIGYADV